MKRNRKRYFSWSMLTLAFCMLQLHIMAGCCFVHHDHTSTMPADGLSVTANCNGQRSHHEEEGVHFCDRSSSDHGEDEAPCLISLLSDTSRLLVKVTHFVISVWLPRSADAALSIRISKSVSFDDFLVSSFEIPLYLRYNSFLN